MIGQNGSCRIHHDENMEVSSRRWRGIIIALPVNVEISICGLLEIHVSRYDTVA